MSAAPCAYLIRSAFAALICASFACSTDEPTTGLSASDVAVASFSPSTIAQGRQIFRFDTFGDEAFWSDRAQLHLKLNTLTPQAALDAGLKVDGDVLPASLKQQLRDNQVPLGDPAITVALIEMGAVVGVVGQVANGAVVRVGITCALCHSTVDNSVVPSVGSRLDGWPNRDLNVGAIIAMSDFIPDSPYSGWGPGKYDPRFNIDGQNHPVVIPPAFGLRHVRKEIYTGDDDVSYWNAYVAITQMGGRGTFIDPRINVSVVNSPPDLVLSKLPALRAYQLSLETPAARPGTYDAAAAARGKDVFRDSGCTKCHSGSVYSDINANRLWTGEEVGQNPAYALRSVTKKYRTTPLRGLWNPPQLDGPYFHDGSAATLMDVVNHYVTHFQLSLTAQQKSDLVQFLRTL